MLHLPTKPSRKSNSCKASATNHPPVHHRMDTNARRPRHHLRRTLTHSKLQTHKKPTPKTLDPLSTCMTTPFHSSLHFYDIHDSLHSPDSKSQTVPSSHPDVAWRLLPTACCIRSFNCGRACCPPFLPLARCPLASLWRSLLLPLSPLYHSICHA